MSENTMLDFTYISKINCKISIFYVIEDSIGIFTEAIQPIREIKP